MNSNIAVLSSINNNLIKFFKGKSNDDFLRIVDVINFTSGFEKHINDKKNNIVINEFLDEFIGMNEWCNLLLDLKPDNKSFFRKARGTTYDMLQKIRVLIIPMMASRLRKQMIKTDKEKIKFLNLKVDVLQAVENSYEDGIFYKDNGWCNVSDALVKHKVIKLNEE